MFLSCTRQVSDYGVLLKMEDWEKLHEASYKMLVVMASLRVGEYTRCLLMHLNVLAQHHDVNSAIYEMYRTNPGAFNEESGEISFSVLAKSSVADTQKMKIEHVNKLYKLLHVYREITEDINDDINGPLEERKYTTGRYIIDPASPEVLQTTSYFQGVIRDILAGAHTVYDGSLEGYYCKVDSFQHLEKVNDVTSVRVLQRQKALDYIHAQKLWVTNKLGNYWIHDYKDVWPDAVIEDESEEDDFLLNPNNSDGDEVPLADVQMQGDDDNEQFDDEEESSEDEPLAQKAAGANAISQDSKSANKAAKRVDGSKKRKAVDSDNQDEPESPIITEPEDSDGADDEKELYVRKIVDIKKKSGKLWYKVRWAGYGPAGDTYESFSDLKRTMSVKALNDFIKAYKEQQEEDEQEPEQ
jgi:hypothetical protein